jgi:hypothetical protein
MVSLTLLACMVTTAPFCNRRRRTALAQASARGVGQTDASEGMHQHVRCRCPPQAQLISTEGLGRESSGDQVKPTFLDAVLGLAAREIKVVVQCACRSARYNRALPSRYCLTRLVARH